MLPNANSHCRFTVTVSDMKSKISSRFYVRDGVGGGGGGGVCAWSGWFLLQSPEMKLSFLLQFLDENIYSLCDRGRVVMGNNVGVSQ